MGTEQALRPDVATFRFVPGDLTREIWQEANVAYLREHPPTRVVVVPVR